MVWEAYHKVRANGGSAGVDEESIKDFDANLSNNLYKLWNRLTSGSYFPPAVKEVEIPKEGGKVRKLGIPTVSDRIAQMVVKDLIEPGLEPVFHSSSFGYRPGKSAHNALEQATHNCRTYDMVIDLDIQAFFDEIDHELLKKALARHVTERWIIMYVTRWLEAPVQQKDGILKQRTVGTPQGGVISPLLANLMLHYCFDKWMQYHFPLLPFERYADDIIVHCRTPEQASFVLTKITERFTQCKLRVHPQKTKIVYCKDSNRTRRKHPLISFRFLGYTFMPRECKSKQGKRFYSFTPAISKEAVKKINDEVKGMKLHSMVQTRLEVIASMLNPKISGWINYYSRFRKSALWKVFYVLNSRLFKWVCWKYKKYRRNLYGAINWLRRLARTNPNLFAHWKHGFMP
ncbi:group II intron reverse transcriptase/nicotine-degrading enzyme NicX [Chitinophaga oryziterrae]